MEKYLNLSFDIDSYDVHKNNAPENYDIQLIRTLDRRLWYIEAKKRYEKYEP